MNKEIISSLDSNNPYHMAAFQCAPVLSGIKTSNLLIIGKKNYMLLKENYHSNKLESKVLSEINGKVSALIYNRKMLEENLLKPENMYFLESMGYTNFSVKSVLKELSTRYDEYLKNKGDFPHEMGIVLGYPVGDVYGFMRNEGRNYIFSGYWKVYTNPAAAKQKFKKYDKVTERLLSRIIYSESNRAYA